MPTSAGDVLARSPSLSLSLSLSLPPSYYYVPSPGTMFYTDTTVTDHGLIPAEAFLKAHKELPQVVFFPEESDFQYRSGTAPLQDNWGGYGMGTPLGAQLLYGRDAFVFELMQFPPGGSPAGPQPIYNNQSLLQQYAKIVKRGDILRYQVPPLLQPPTAWSA